MEKDYQKNQQLMKTFNLFDIKVEEALDLVLNISQNNSDLINKLKLA